MSGQLATCALCPRLCRPACPVATGSQREAAVPANIAGTLIRWQRGETSPELAAQAATLCTDCGACEAWCHLDQPLPALLAEARSELLPEAIIEPLRPIQGEGRRLAIEADGRPLARALSEALGEPVRRWFTADRLGVAAVEHANWEPRARALRQRVAAVEEIVVADGGVARALRAAGIDYRWLHEVLPELARGAGSCEIDDGERPLACCGAGGPLRDHHPEDARRVGRAWLRRADGQQVLDARCRHHLLACGGLEVADPLDLLLGEDAP